MGVYDDKNKPPSPVVIGHWPGGTTISGGTRNTVDLNKLSRPWQREIELPLSHACAFCSKLFPEQILEELDGPNGEKWLRIQNMFSPFDPERTGKHQLIIPKTCMPVERLRALGGAEAIEFVLKTGIDDIISHGDKRSEWIISVHIGALSGQNIPHLHWHFIKINEPNPPNFDWTEINRQRKNLVILKNSDVEITAGGLRTGQCLISVSPDANFPGIAQALSNLVNIGNGRFKSVQGLPPDFSLALYCGYDYSTLYRYTELDFGIYTPILNNLGGTEMLAPYLGTPYCLAWPHEMTAKHLRGE